MSGEGAFRAGGRWNTAGNRAVYASGNLTLAMLEVFVHVDDAENFLQAAHVYHRVSLPETLTAVLEEQDLPLDWDARPERPGSQTVGDEWLEAQETPVLAVPSVLLPSELRYDPLYMNYLINPAHPKIEAIEVGPLQELHWDARLRTVL